jgi:hypothetical protein
MQAVQTKRFAKKIATSLGSIVALTGVVLIGLWPGYAISQLNSLHHVEPKTYSIAAQYSDAPLALQNKDDLLAYMKLAEVRTLVECTKSAEKQEDLEEIARAAEPYIAHELQINSVNRPRILPVSISENISGSYRLSGPYGMNYIEFDGKSDELCKLIITHESIHAQILALPYYKALAADLMNFFGKKSSLYDETYVQVATLEVLADQALDGDKEAKLTLLNFISTMNVVRKGEISRWDPPYYTFPLDIFFNASSGKQKYYQGIELDGMAEFARMVVMETKARPN